jgi:peptidoglycan/xylan/chitin deacetylase (PgdA/CDA1 family)
MKSLLLFLAACWLTMNAKTQTVIRYNQLGYTCTSPKVLVLGSKQKSFQLKYYALIDLATGKPLIQRSTATEKDFGAYGPFVHSYRINLSAVKKPGIYQLVVNDSIRSGTIRIGDDVYKGSADFCLRYMRQQRSGFNPFLNDSCHMFDGYVRYSNDAMLPDSTHIDVVGGWHDASDYLQYSTTSANAAYHLLMAYRDYPKAFSDFKLANGLDGNNKVPDVLDEAVWGVQWLLKMFPNKNWMFNQLGDDRDHISMRIPKLDSQYGKGYERPVYFIDGEKQQQGKGLNHTEGTSSTAAKFASVFALAASLQHDDSIFSRMVVANDFATKALDAYAYALKKPGVTQTVSVKAPYIYAESNWVDDMELATARLYAMPGMQADKKTGASFLQQSYSYAQQEPITPWLGKDTAAHYQWYPFINLGHRELVNVMSDKSSRNTLIHFYKQGIEKVWAKAKQNAFYRGVPFIWCSNNLTVGFATQCLWYKQLTGDTQFEELEQANIDWLFGTNPWGTSMVYGLPAWGDTPVDPHSAFTHLKNYPIDGGLVDGPVYTSISKGLIGLTLYQPDEYAEWQSDLAVYHDDYGDYSTNEPTMDGTASLIYLLAALESPKLSQTNKQQGALQPVGADENKTIKQGAIIRSDSTKKELTLVFTGHEFAEGLPSILQALKKSGLTAAFFFTGDFVRRYPALVKQTVTDGHYVGPHSDKHLLYADWTKRDSTLVTKAQFQQDLLDNYKALQPFGITKQKAPWFLPAFEWYNQDIADWSAELGVQLICHTPGTISTADYTTLADKNYRSTAAILQSINEKASQPNGLNGFLLLTHVGAGAGRPDPFSVQLPALITNLQGRGYKMVPLAQLLR